MYIADQPALNLEDFARCYGRMNDKYKTLVKSLPAENPSYLCANGWRLSWQRLQAIADLAGTHPFANDALADSLSRRPLRATALDEVATGYPDLELVTARIASHGDFRETIAQQAGYSESRLNDFGCYRARPPIELAAEVFCEHVGVSLAKISTERNCRFLIRVAEWAARQPDYLEARRCLMSILYPSPLRSHSAHKKFFSKRLSNTQLPAGAFALECRTGYFHSPDVKSLFARKLPEDFWLHWASLALEGNKGRSPKNPATILALLIPPPTTSPEKSQREVERVAKWMVRTFFHQLRPFPDAPPPRFWITRIETVLDLHPNAIPDAMATHDDRWTDPDFCYCPPLLHDHALRRAFKTAELMLQSQQPNHS